MAEEINKDDLDRMGELSRLTRITPSQTQELFKYYKKYINPKFIGCAKCAASIRQAHKNIKNFYALNK